MTDENFSFRAPRQKGRYRLTVKPIGQKVGVGPKGERPRLWFAGETEAMVAIERGKTRRRGYVPLAD